MINKILNKLFSQKISKKDIEYVIKDEEVRKIEEQPYVGVPAPILNKPDNWFTPLPSEFMTEKQKIYKRTP